MTPQEKAKELFSVLWDIDGIEGPAAKKAATYIVEEIIKVIPLDPPYKYEIPFWVDTKKEIEKL